MLEKLLGADPGYRGPRVPCGHGHQAEFASYRDKVIDTVLGPVASPAPGTTAGLRARPAPREVMLGVARQSISLGSAIFAR